MALACLDCRNGSVRAPAPAASEVPVLARHRQCSGVVVPRHRSACTHPDRHLVLEERIAELERWMDDIASS